MIRVALVVLSAAFGLLTPAPAHAVIRYVRFCFLIDVDFDDDFVGDWITDTDTQDMVARGIWYEVDQVAGQGVAYWSGYAEDDGTYKGCTPLLSMEDEGGNAEYTVLVQSKAEVNGNTVRSYYVNLGTAYLNNFWIHSPANTFTPTISEVRYEPAIAANPQQMSNLAVAGWALINYDGGGDYTYNFYDDVCFDSDLSDSCSPISCTATGSKMSWTRVNAAERSTRARGTTTSDSGGT